MCRCLCGPSGRVLLHILLEVAGLVGLGFAVHCTGPRINSWVQLERTQVQQWLFVVPAVGGLLAVASQLKALARKCCKTEGGRTGGSAWCMAVSLLLGAADVATHVQSVLWCRREENPPWDVCTNKAMRPQKPPPDTTAPNDRLMEWAVGSVGGRGSPDLGSAAQFTVLSLSVILMLARVWAFFAAIPWFVRAADTYYDCCCKGCCEPSPAYAG